MKNEKEINMLREKYPSGTKIKLLQDIEDLYDIPAGTIGEVDFIDDAGNIHMEWEIGSKLSLIEGVDSFEIVSKPNKIKVIVCEPKKEPYVKEIYETLNAEQELVGGLIQCVPSMFDDNDSYDFMVNEEGKIEGLPLNRYIYEKQDIVCGNLVLIKTDNSTGEFVTLDDSEIPSLIEKLKEQCPKYEEQSLSHDEMEEIEK